MSKNIAQLTMKPNQLRLTVTDVNAKEISVIVELQGIQNISNSQGEEAVKATIFKLFKDVVDRMKTPAR